ncbi:MAG: hypothetical protein WAX04_02925 [Oscillospiraceae bacterium]
MNYLRNLTIKSVGKILLAIGIISFIIGLILVLFAVFSLAFWLVMASIVLNIVGITLITTKTT